MIILLFYICSLLILCIVNGKLCAHWCRTLHTFSSNYCDKKEREKEKDRINIAEKCKRIINEGFGCIY